MATEKFHWTSPAGVEITLPRMTSIKAGILRKHRKAEPVDFLFTVVEEVADEATLAKLDDLELDDLNALFEAWQQAGANLGESGSSST